MIGLNTLQRGRWVAIDVNSRTHPIVGMGQPVKPADPKRGSYSRYEAWHDLLMEAQWKPFQARNKGKVVLIERGQLLAARSWLASRWNWTEKTVRGFLNRLEDDVMIRLESGQSKGQRKGHYTNVLTICNYDIYQTSKELDGLMKGQSEDQSRASQGPEKGQNTTKIQDTKIQEGSLSFANAQERDSSSAWIADDGSLQIMNGKRAALKAILGPRVNLDEALISISAVVAGAPPAELWERITDAATEHRQRVEAAKAAAPARGRKVSDQYSESFGYFWDLYPRKIGKGAANEKWKGLTVEQQRRAYASLKTQIPFLQGKMNDPRGNFCPHPATWLGQGRFDDEPTEHNSAELARKEKLRQFEEELERGGLPV